jgi:4-hydroxybenzoate polyprenyltransferase/phosphoserine phosphatase
VNLATPCVVDLDGTLLNSDSLHESILKIIFENPLMLLRLPFWLLRGKAFFKSKVANLVEIDASTLPYNAELIDWLKLQKEAGRPLVLCTAADTKVAKKIANFLGIFDEVIASEGTLNLAGRNKGEALKQKYGDKGFDYAGNAAVDLGVWQYARKAVIVNARHSVHQRVIKCCEVDVVMPSKNSNFFAIMKALRLHQWLKNILLFVPILAAHEVSDVVSLVNVALGFLAFSLTASAVYLVNDLADLDSDRRHPRKRKRPFAAGDIPLYYGVALSPLLLCFGFLIANYVNNGFLLWLLGYLFITTLYTFFLKKLVLIDCLTLAFLYTLRIVAGAAAVEQELSFWLVAFAVFLFLSLAFIKRNAEINAAGVTQNGKINGRGYIEGDGPLVLVMGVAACYSAVLVFALYLNSEAITLLYKLPVIMWMEVPILLFWMSWMWLQSHRANMHDDPLVFAVKDPVSLLCGLLFALVAVVASVGLPS